MITLAIPDFSRASIRASTANLYSHSLYQSFRIMDCGGKGKELGLGGHSSSTSAEKNNTERVLGTDDAINEGGTSDNTVRVLGTDDAINEEGGTCDDALSVARLAQLDEEYRGAVWLRVEDYWESNQNNDADHFRLDAQMEFDGLKQRCSLQSGNHSKCFVVIDEKSKESLKNRVVGTLELYLQYFSDPKTFSHVLSSSSLKNKEWRESIMGSKYAYLSNLCVAEGARGQGFATAMLKHAISTAHSLGFEKVFVGAYAYNKGAVRLYKKIGFKVVDAANLGQDHSAHPLVFCLHQPST